MDVNTIDWHVTPFRRDRFVALWTPAVERAMSYGARASYLLRTEADPLHLQQISAWDDRSDFERYWASDEISAIRQSALAYFHKPLLPEWSIVIAGTPVPGVPVR